jgi:integral membrane protein
VNQLRLLKIVGWLEGISYLLLLFVAVPLKYAGENEILVKILGMPHGVLFVAYLVLGYLYGSEQKWSISLYIKLLLASLLPFGTIIFDKKYLTDIAK